jgi:hypothetical protein
VQDNGSGDTADGAALSPGAPRPCVTIVTGAPSRVASVTTRITTRFAARATTPTLSSVITSGQPGRRVASEAPESEIAATVTSPAMMPASAARALIRGAVPSARTSAGKSCVTTL